MQIENRKIFRSFNAKDSYTGKITCNTESTADWNMSLEWWGQLWVFRVEILV